MIGVIVEAEEQKIAEEFFQLFKTPWQLYDPKKSYDVVITTNCEDVEDINARLIIIYNSGNKISGMNSIGQKQPDIIHVGVRIK